MPKYRIEVDCLPVDGNHWLFTGLVTRHDHAVMTVNKITSLDMAAFMQLCGDAITEDIAWQEAYGVRKRTMQELADLSQELDMGY